MSRGHRGSTTPMDFEWSNQHGPVDERSPFITAVSQSAVKKRPHSVLESPSKNTGFATPNRPQSYFFSTPQANDRPLPSIPSHVQNSKTWEPRTPASLVDFSSGGETPNTPGIDSEQATPDTQMASKMGKLLNGESSKGPKKVSRRDSWFKQIFSSSPSPTKDKEESRKNYSKKGENRVTKRRTKKKITLRDDMDDSDDEHQSKKIKGGQGDGKVNQTFAMSMAGFLSWVEAHPNLPSVLSYYMQLAVNTFLGLGFIYIVYACWSGIMNDVEIQSSKFISEIMIEQSLCARQYAANRCQPGTRVPGMEVDCNNWQKCMERDARKVARASVTAKTFAMIFNSFVEEFSYKSMIFTAIILFGGFNLSNWAFGFIREKQLSHQQHNDFGPPPQTPHRYPSNGYIEHQHQQWQQTPFQTPYGSMNAHMLQHNMASQSMPTLALPSTADAEDERKSPSKRRLFR